MKRIPYRWVIAFILFFCYSIQYLDRVKTAVLNPSIMKDIGLTASGVGTGAMLMMIFYAPAEYISGILTDKYGAKKVPIFSVIAWSLMTAWDGISPHSHGILLSNGPVRTAGGDRICPFRPGADALV